MEHHHNCQRPNPAIEADQTPATYWRCLAAASLLLLLLLPAASFSCRLICQGPTPTPCYGGITTFPTYSMFGGTP